MSERSERLYKDLNTEHDLESLIGKPEDGDFDCKVWSGNSDTSRGTIAKAACGFTNATGGVLIIGMEAAGRTAEMPDVVQSLAHVADRQAVSTATLDIINKFVEPGIAGIEHKTIPHNGSTKEGYVLVHVPESLGSPRRVRTKTDKQFYVRIASGTIPMEYFQIEDRFGRRPHPRLIVEVSHERIENAQYPFQGVQRKINLSIRNEGRGIARFPCLRFRNTTTFNVLNHPYSSETPPWKVYRLAEWTSIRGSTNDVIYPGELFTLATMTQNGHPYRDDGSGQRTNGITNPNSWDYAETDLEIEILCDDMPPYRQAFHFAQTTHKF